MDIEVYNHIRSGRAGFHEQKRGLIAVWGKEAVQFLDGMITNDMKTLEDGQQMLAAFPNAQGRLIAVVRVLRDGDRFLIETEEATREKLYQNLFRFTFAGDFFVSDFSNEWQYFELFGDFDLGSSSDWFQFTSGRSTGMFVGKDAFEILRRYTFPLSHVLPIPDETYETLRIESGIPKFGVDMDEATIVPELGFPEMISYTKGCYVGQEIIARIHFRGHVAKQLTGLVCESPVEVGSTLATLEGKDAGRVTSMTYSPGHKQNIALAFVRYDYLASGTDLLAGESKVTVTELPFI